MATATTIPAIRPEHGSWISSPLWDAFWMFGALWGCALLWLLSQAFGMHQAAALLFAANIVLSISHSFSTTFMVVGSRLLRKERRRNRLKFTYVPIAVVAGSMLLGVVVAQIHAYPPVGRFSIQHWLWALYLGVFWVGHFWHFGNQDFGVLSIYRLKSGQTDTRDRRIDKAYAVAMMFVIQPVIYLKSVSTSPASETLFSFMPFIMGHLEAAADVVIVVACALTLGVVAFELRKSNRSTPKLLYYVVMLVHPLVLYSIHFGLAFYYFISYFWSHWLIAIGLVGRIHTNAFRDAGATRMGAVARHVLIIGGIAVFAGALHVFYGTWNVFSGRQYKEILGAVEPGYLWLLGLMLGYFLAEQLLHYYCDRCLFRFRDPGVRRAVAPLV